jgi:hypothetical protein
VDAASVSLGDGGIRMAAVNASDMRARLGFRDGDRGTHSSRTLMFAELELLLEATAPDAAMSDYRRAAVEENVLGKRTRVTREHTVRKLKALYGLDPALPVFRALRTFWPLDAEGRPLLAMLCGFARDPLLRLTADAVLDAEVGSIVAPEAVEELLRQRAPGRFSETNERAIAVRVLSSWTQSGHLAGQLDKSRTRAKPTPSSTAYALFLAYLEGRRAQRLFDSAWSRVLDAPAPRLMDLARPRPKSSGRRSGARQNPNDGGNVGGATRVAELAHV